MTRTDGLRRDRDGELVPEGFDLATVHVCMGITGGRGRGWLGQDAQGRPIPCPVCKPHTARGRDLLPASADLPTVTGAA
ncbi:hypothetical protein V5H98_15200 [Georgenia sp. M64]|uniref:hypothetical protein n=1 Tax=Georgenia sp. M64 TaxID=3120520 RepID=UPI0030E0E388